MATRNKLAFGKHTNQENVKKVTTNSLLMPGQTRRAALGEIGNQVNLTKGVDKNLKSNIIPQKKHDLPNSKKVEKLQVPQDKPVEKIVTIPKKDKDLSTSATLAKAEELYKKYNIQKKQEPEQKKKETHVKIEPLPISAGIEDIDENDKNNPMLVSEYSNDIHEYLRSLEKQYPIRKNYLQSQNVTPKMRCVLIDWLVEVHQQFHLLQETLYMTVATIDRFMQSFHSITTKTLQLVGVTAMFIACKYEEMYSPDITDFMYITDNTYSKKDILQMEAQILRTLDFSFGRPLQLHFLRRYSKAGKALPLHHTMAKYFLELSLIRYEMCHYPPSIIAAAALYLAFYLTMSDDKSEGDDASDSIWTHTLVYYSTYTKQQIMPIVYDLASMVVDSEKSKYQAVRKKYSVTKNMKVSLRAELRSLHIYDLAQKKENTQVTQSST